MLYYSAKIATLLDQLNNKGEANNEQSMRFRPSADPAQAVHSPRQVHQRQGVPRAHL